MQDVTCYDEAGNSLTYLTQWDCGRSITVKGLELGGSPEFHFFNKNSAEALVIRADYDYHNDCATAYIPNILLQAALPVILFVYKYMDVDKAKTVARIQLPVRAKLKPSDYNYVENIEYYTAVAMEEDITRKINSLNLACEKTEEDDYTISLYNENGIELSNCVLPIGDVIDNITINSNGYTLRAEKLDNDDFEISLYNIRGIRLSHCNIEASNLKQQLESFVESKVEQHNSDIMDIRSDISEINNDIADIRTNILGETLLDFHTKYMLSLFPTYSVQEKRYTHYTGDTYGNTIPITAEEYDPEINTMMVWVNYELQSIETNYIINNVGETNYAIVFNQPLDVGSKIIIQIWTTNI